MVWTTRRKRKIGSLSKSEECESKLEWPLDIWTEIMLRFTSLRDLLRLSYACRELRLAFEKRIRDVWKTEVRDMRGHSGKRLLECMMPFYSILAYCTFYRETLLEITNILIPNQITYSKECGRDKDSMHYTEVPESGRKRICPLSMAAYVLEQQAIKDNLSTDWYQAIRYCPQLCLRTISLVCIRSYETHDARFGNTTELVCAQTLATIFTALKSYLFDHKVPCYELLLKVLTRHKESQEGPVLLRRLEPRFLRMLLGEYEIWRILLSDEAE